MNEPATGELWKLAPIIKVYEALGALGDGRYELGDNTARVFSSRGNKAYDVRYDSARNAIMANDNGSYWQGYLGYPGIVLLLALDKVPYDPRLPQVLKGFAWQDINQQFKNDFAKTQQYVDTEVVLKSGLELRELHDLVEAVQRAVYALQLRKLGKRQKPPTEFED
ncbi:MAG TPA: hypothetical protein VI322_00605 [Candidatus Saccharimonadia bacterium]